MENTIMVETGVVIGADVQSVVYWHTPTTASSGSLPDDVKLWDILWANRKNVIGFAHTHPDEGHLPGPSSIDLSTFAAIEMGLNKRLLWWILNLDRISYTLWEGNKYNTHEEVIDLRWALTLRRLSRMAITRQPYTHCPEHGTKLDVAGQCPSCLLGLDENSLDPDLGL